MEETIMSDCTLCPRNCASNREAGVKGFCGESKDIRIARAALHFWEEPVISGQKGSGAVFFTGCNLKCIFCQNASIAANKVNGVRAGVCSDATTARLIKEHNNANILAFGARIVGPELAKDMVKAYLEAEFFGGRHQTRVEMFAEIEKRN